MPFVARHVRVHKPGAALESGDDMGLADDNVRTALTMTFLSFSSRAWTIVRAISAAFDTRYADSGKPPSFRLPSLASLNTRGVWSCFRVRLPLIVLDERIDFRDLKIGVLKSVDSILTVESAAPGHGAHHTRLTAYVDNPERSPFAGFTWFFELTVHPDE